MVMHGVFTISDNGIVNFRMDGYLRHVGKPKWIEEFIELTKNGGIC